MRFETTSPYTSEGLPDELIAMSMSDSTMPGLSSLPPWMTVGQAVLDGGASLLHGVRLALEDKHVATQRERAVEALLEGLLREHVVLPGERQGFAVAIQIDDRARPGVTFSPQAAADQVAQLLAVGASGDLGL